MGFNSGFKGLTFSNIVILHTYLLMKMEQTECSETSAYNIQAPLNYPKETIQQVSTYFILINNFGKHI